MTGQVIKEQSRFWDTCNIVEHPFVRYVQCVFFAKTASTFWLGVAALASARLLALSPSLLYCLGHIEEAKRLAISLVFYALLSSFGKSWVTRRRPGSYDDIWVVKCPSTSSFPSRHSIAATVLADFLPAPLKYPYLVLLVICRLACGVHYLSDCIVGVGIGQIALAVAPMVENVNLSTALLILALQIWSGAAKILAGALPVLIAPDVRVAKVLVGLAFLKAPLLNAVRKGKRERDRMKVLTQELLVVSAILFVVVRLDELLTRYHVKEILPHEWIQQLF
jgi:hypothetical protein